MNIIEIVVQTWVDNPDGTQVKDLAHEAMGLLRGGGIPLAYSSRPWTTRPGSRHCRRACRPPARVPDAPLGESPVFSSTYIAGGDRGYGRFDNDAWTALEETLGAARRRAGL